MVAAESLIFFLPQSRCSSQPLFSGGSGCTWLPVPSSLSSTGEGAGFDVCRDTGRKSISMLCVLECKRMINFFSQPARCTCSTSVLLFILQALMSLFVLASKDGWVNIMYNGLDAVAVDQQVQQLPCERTFFTFLGLVRQKHALKSCFKTPPSNQESLPGSFGILCPPICKESGSCLVHAGRCSCGCAVAVCNNSHPLLSLDLIAGLYLFVMMEQRCHVPFWACWLPPGPQMAILILCKAETVGLLPTASIFFYC